MDRRVLIGSLVLGAAAGLAVAGPLEKGVVAPGAKWVVHVDVEALRQSTVCTFVLEHERRLDPDLPRLRKMKEEFGLDPLTDIKSLTVYGDSPDPGECVAVLRTTDAVDGLLTRLVDEKKVLQKIEEGPYTIYTWAEGDEQRHAFVKRGAGADRTVIAATDKARLLAGIRQLDAPAAAAPAEGVLASTPRAGSVVFVAGTSMDCLRDAQASMMLQKAESVVLDMGESGGEVYADLRLTTSSSEEAGNMLMVAQGGMGLARMYSQREPELKCFAAALDWVKLEAEGPALRARVNCSSKDLHGFLEGAAKAAEERKNAEAEKTRAAEPPRRRID
ncbi:MAG: hypothetical protein WD749_09445 [Phycisphaerales bacterium]